MHYPTTLFRIFCGLAMSFLITTDTSAQADHMEILVSAGNGKFYKDDNGQLSFNIQFRKNWTVVPHLYLGIGIGLVAVKSEAAQTLVFSNSIYGSDKYEYNRYYTGIYAPLGAGYIYENRHTVFSIGADITPVFYLDVNNKGHESNVTGEARTAGWGVMPNICYTKKVNNRFALGLKAFANFLQSPSKEYSGLSSSIIGGGIVFQF